MPLSGAAVALRTEAGVVVRRLDEVGKDSLLTAGPQGEVYSLRCVLEEELSDAQWREAGAEFCGRLLRGEERPLTLAEVLGTAERLARLKLCHEVLEAASGPESYGRHGLTNAICGRAVGGAVIRCEACPALVGRLREAAAAEFLSEAVCAELSRQLTPWDEQAARVLAATAGKGASAPPPSAVPQAAAGVVRCRSSVPQAACHDVGIGAKAQSEAAAMAQAAALRSQTGVAEADAVPPYTIASPPPLPPCSRALPLPQPQRALYPGLDLPVASTCATSRIQDEDRDSARSRGGSRSRSPSPELGRKCGRNSCRGRAGGRGQALSPGQQTPAGSGEEPDASVSETAGDHAPAFPTRLPPRARSRSRSRERGCVESATQRPALAPGPPVGWAVDPHYHLSAEEEAWAVDLYMWLRSRPGCRATTGEILRADKGVPQKFLDRSGRGPMAYMDLFAGESGLWASEHIGVCFRFTAVVTAAAEGRPGGGGSTELPRHQVEAAAAPSVEGATAVQLAEAGGAVGQDGGGGGPGMRPSSLRPASGSLGKGESADAFAVRLYGYLRAKLPHGVLLCHLKGTPFDIPSHLLRLWSPALLVKRYRDMGLWSISEVGPLSLTAQTGEAVDNLLMQLRGGYEG